MEKNGNRLLDNELKKTDTLWYKIKNFFTRVFLQKEKCIEDEMISNKRVNSFNQNISLKKELEKEKQKRDLANNIMNQKISIENLSDNQVNEMIIYFEQYINDINKELSKIRCDIIKIKKSNL